MGRTRSLHTLLGADGAGRRLLMGPFASSTQRNHHHVPAVSGTSFVRSFAVCSAPSSSPQRDYYDRTVNGGKLSVSGTAGILSCTRRLVSSSIPGASPPSETQPQYFEGPWYGKYLLLEEYKKEHGNCLVPYSYAVGGVKLGMWVHTQRQFYKKDKLSSSRMEMLDALGFSWDPFADKWGRNFALLEQYKGREGHCDVPKIHEEDEVKLGKWIDRQRQDYKKGKLDESHQQRLENLGVSWDPLVEQWERNFALLEQYKKREGHVNVPQRHEEDGLKLGTWVTKQRGNYKKGKIDESRHRRLENLGMSWDQLADQRERNFGLLEQYKEREGHGNVPMQHEEDGVNLGYWVNTQRQLYKTGKLDESYQHRLEKLGVSWDPLVEQWEQNFSLLEQYKEREGHGNVPQVHEEDGVKLGLWLNNLRQVRKGKPGILGADRIERLDKLGIRWS